MKRIVTAIIATAKEMLSENLINANPSEETFFWVYQKNIMSNKYEWTPIANCSLDKKEDSTHFLSGYYFSFPKSDLKEGEFAFLSYCEKFAGEDAIPCE